VAGIKPAPPCLKYPASHSFPIRFVIITISGWNDNLIYGRWINTYYFVFQVLKGIEQQQAIDSDSGKAYNQIDITCIFYHFFLLAGKENGMVTGWSGVTSKLLFKWSATALAVFTLVSLLVCTAGGVAEAQTPPLQVKWEVENPPTEGRAGLRLTFPRIKLTNTGTQTWTASGQNELKVGYRWFYGHGTAIPRNQYQEVRASLPQDIPPNGSIVYPNFQVAMPNLPGDFILHIDLVQGTEGYLQTRGIKDFEVKVAVRAGDGAAPVVQVTPLPLISTSTLLNISWNGKDEDGGSGLQGFEVQYKIATDNEWTNWLTNTTLTSTQFRGENGKTYQFRIRAYDKSGNASVTPFNGQIITRIDALPPSSIVESLPDTSPSSFLVRWSSYDNADGPNTALFDVQYREGDSGAWVDWLGGTAGTAALFSGKPGMTYQFRVRAQDYAGNRSEFPSAPQATTKTTPALDSVFGAQNQPVKPAGSTTGPTTLFFPLAIKNGDNNSGTMGFVVKNPTDKPADVFVRYNNWAGAPNTKKVNDQDVAVDDNEAIALNRVVTLLETIPANSSKTFWAGNLYLPVYNGWAAVVSSSPVTASAVRLSGDGKIIQYLPSEAGQKLYLPGVSKLEAFNSSIIALANPGSRPVAVDITYYNENGGVVFTEKRELPRLGSTRFTLAGLRTPDQNLRFSGSAVISAPTPVIASVENYLEDGTIATYPAQAKTTKSSPEYNVFKNVDGYTSSAIIQNTTDKPIPVKIEYLDDKGQVVGSLERQLQSHARYIAWQGALQTAEFNGKLRINTGDEVAVVLIGAGPGLKDRLFP
jgi:hypothetical protein